MGESARHSAFSFLDGEVIAADPGSVGEGITISLRREHLFTPRPPSPETGDVVRVTVDDEGEFESQPA